MPFSVLIITKNEAHNIQNCLDALQGLSDDVILLDSGSTDQTVAIASKWGAKVHETEWLGYAATKNKGHQCCKYDWILSIDADEWVSEDLRRSLSQWKGGEKSVYYLDRLTTLAGKEVKHSGWYPDWKPRLYHRDHAQWEGAYVHEDLSFPKDFAKIRLRGKLFHHSYTDDQDHYRRMMKYAHLSAKAMFARNKRPNWWKRHISPLARFFRTLIIKRGFLDGMTGWKIANRNYFMVKEKYRLLDKMYREQ